MSSLPLVGGRMAMAPRLSRRPVVALLPRRATTIQSRRCLSSRNDHDSQKQQQQQQKQEQQQSGKVTWYPIPVGLGIACIGLLQIYKVSTREDKQQAQQTPAAQAQQAEADASQQGSQATNPDETKKPKRRPRVRPDGPW